MCIRDRYYTEDGDSQIDWHTDYGKVNHDGKQPLPVEFCREIKTPDSDEGRSPSPENTEQPEVAPAPGLEPPPKTDVAPDSPLGLFGPSGSTDDKTEVKDEHVEEDISIGRLSDVDTLLQPAPPVSTEPLPQAEDTREATRDDAEEGTQAKSRQFLLRFAINYRTVLDEVRLANGDVDTNHPNITHELGKKLSELGVAGRYKKKTFKEEQDRRTHKSGEPKDNGRIVYLEIVCGQNNHGFILDRLVRDRKHRFRLYGGLMTLDDEKSQSDSDETDSSYSYDTSSSYKSGPPEQEPSSSPDRRAASPSKRARSFFR